MTISCLKMYVTLKEMKNFNQCSSSSKGHSAKQATSSAITQALKMADNNTQ